MGGKSSTEILRTLNNSGVMVTYGGMSREPVIVPTASFIFKDIQLRGFWMTRWHKENLMSDQRKQMYDTLSQFMRDGKLIAPPHKAMPLDSYKETLQHSVSSKGFIGFKHFFDLQK